MNSPIVTSPAPVARPSRDARLLSALHLLETPVRKVPSPYLPLLVSTGLAGSALLLAYTMVIGHSLKNGPPVDRTRLENNPGFEISSHPDTPNERKIKAPSASSPANEAVLVGTEASR